MSAVREYMAARRALREACRGMLASMGHGGRRAPRPDELERMFPDTLRRYALARIALRGRLASHFPDPATGRVPAWTDPPASAV